jgi:hypothetical protein
MVVTPNWDFCAACNRQGGTRDILDNSRKRCARPEARLRA